MPNREVVIRVTTQTESAESGMKAVGESVKGVGKAATEAKAGLDPVDAVIDRINKAAEKGTLTWGQLRGEFTKLPGPLAEIGVKTLTVVEALTKMEAKKDSPAGLGRAAAIAKVQLDDLRASIDRATAAGAKFGPDVAQGLAKFEAQITSATARSGMMRDVLGDMSLKGKLSGDVIETLSGSLGSVQQALTVAHSAGTGWVGMLGTAGLTAIIVQQGLALLKAAWDGIRTTIDTATKAILGLDEASIAHSTAMAKMAASTADARHETEALISKGVTPLSTSFDKINSQYQDLALKGGRWSMVQQEHAKLAGVTIPEALDKTRARAETMGAALEGAFARSRTEGILLAQSNQSTLESLEKLAQLTGEALPKGVREGLEAIRRLREEEDALRKVTQELGDKYRMTQATLQSLSSAVQNLVQDYAKEAAEAQKSAVSAVASAAKKRKALDEEGLSAEEYFKKKKAIADEESAAIRASTDQELSAKARLTEGEAKLMAERGLSAEQLTRQLKTAAELNATNLEQLATNPQLVEVWRRLTDSAREQAGTVDKSKTATEQFGDTVRQLPGPIAAVTTGWGEWGKTAGDANEKLAEFVKKLNQAPADLKTLGTALESSHGSSDKLRDSAGKLVISLDGVERGARRARDAVRELGTALDDVSRKADAAAGPGAGGMVPSH